MRSIDRAANSGHSNANKARIANEVGLKPGKLTYVALAQHIGLAQTTANYNVRGLINMGLLATAKESEPAIRTRASLVFWPRQRLWDIHSDSIQQIHDCEYLAPELRAIYDAALENRLSMVNTPEDSPEHLLYGELYLGHTAVLAKSIATPGRWWNGEAGWKSLVDLETVVDKASI